MIPREIKEKLARREPQLTQTVWGLSVLRAVLKDEWTPMTTGQALDLLREVSGDHLAYVRPDSDCYWYPMVFGNAIRDCGDERTALLIAIIWCWENPRTLGIWMAEWCPVCDGNPSPANSCPCYQLVHGGNDDPSITTRLDVDLPPLPTRRVRTKVKR